MDRDVGQPLVGCRGPEDETAGDMPLPYATNARNKERAVADPGALQSVIAHWRWASKEGRGGMAMNLRVREYAQRDAYARAVAEAERAAGEDDAALLRLAESWRERCLGGWLPDDVPLPPAPPNRPGRPQPQMEEADRRREQQIGYALALAACASQLYDVAGGAL